MDRAGDATEGQPGNAVRSRRVTLHGVRLQTAKKTPAFQVEIREDVNLGVLRKDGVCDGFEDAEASFGCFWSCRGQNRR